MRPSTRNKPGTQSRKRQIDSSTVDQAVRAIHQGDKSLAEISDMVRPMAGGSRFSGDLGLDSDLPEITAPERSTRMRDQEVFGVRFPVAMVLSCTLGVFAGVPLGITLDGTALQIAAAALFPFLG